MKTILVIYTDVEVADAGYTKRYAFNTHDDVVVGDMLKSSNYDSNMQVVEVLDECFKYFNKTTGELTNSLNNSFAFPIRELELRDENPNVIYASIIRK